MRVDMVKAGTSSECSAGLVPSGDGVTCEDRDPVGVDPGVVNERGLGSEWRGVAAVDGLAGGVARPNKEANGFERRDAGFAGPLGTRAPGRGGRGGLDVAVGRGGMGSAGE